MRHPAVFPSPRKCYGISIWSLLLVTFYVMNGYGDDAMSPAQGQEFLHNLIAGYMSKIPTTGVMQVRSSFVQTTPGVIIQMNNAEYRKELFGKGCFFAQMNNIQQLNKNGNNHPSSSTRLVKVLFNGDYLYQLENRMQVLPSTEGDVQLSESNLLISLFDPRKLSFAAAAFALPCQNLELLQTDANGIGGFMATVLSKQGCHVNVSTNAQTGEKTFTAQATNPDASAGNSQEYTVVATFNPNKGGILTAFKSTQHFSGGNSNYRRVDSLEITDSKEVSPGFWYPTKGVYSTVVNGTTDLSYSFTINSISVENTKLLQADDFLIPPGTTVNDLVHKLKFTSGSKPAELEEAIHQWLDK
jgi:hypothetical protein